MAPSRKSGGKGGGLTVHLTVPPHKLRQILDPPSKEESPVKETIETIEAKDAFDPKESQESPATSVTLPATQPNGDNATDSSPATPAAAGTPAPPSMAPPAEGVNKKKGAKRAAPGTNGEPKMRGKPGPKKKPRLEDGTIDHAAGKGTNVAGAAHKLGPKANQGAINAGLRALDRSGKPCRKWSRGGFRLKSFTGVIWEIHRWTAPPKMTPEGSNADSAAASTSSSTKENKDTQVKSEANSNSNNDVMPDVEMQSAPSINPGSPAPIPAVAVS